MNKLSGFIFNDLTWSFLLMSSFLTLVLPKDKFSILIPAVSSSATFLFLTASVSKTLLSYFNFRNQF